MIVSLATALSDRVGGGRLREAGLQSGLTTEADLHEMARDWNEWMEKEDASVAMMQWRSLNPEIGATVRANIGIVDKRAIKIFLRSQLDDHSQARPQSSLQCLFSPTILT